MSFFDKIKKSFSTSLKSTLEEIINELEKEESLKSRGSIYGLFKGTAQADVINEKGDVLIKHDAQSTGDYGILQKIVTPGHVMLWPQGDIPEYWRKCDGSNGAPSITPPSSGHNWIQFVGPYNTDVPPPSNSIKTNDQFTLMRNASLTENGKTYTPKNDYVYQTDGQNLIYQGTKDNAVKFTFLNPDDLTSQEEIKYNQKVWLAVVDDNLKTDPTLVNYMDTLDSSGKLVSETNLQYKKKSELTNTDTTKYGYQFYICPELKTDAWTKKQHLSYNSHYVTKDSLISFTIDSAKAFENTENCGLFGCRAVSSDDNNNLRARHGATEISVFSMQ
jgi:hypothetical protein